MEKGLGEVEGLGKKCEEKVNEATATDEQAFQVFEKEYLLPDIAGKLYSEAEKCMGGVNIGKLAVSTFRQTISALQAKFKNFALWSKTEMDAAIKRHHEAYFSQTTYQA